MTLAPLSAAWMAVAAPAPPNPTTTRSASTSQAPGVLNECIDPSPIISGSVFYAPVSVNECASMPSVARIIVLEPAAAPQPPLVELAKRPATLDGKRLGFLDNGKPNADVLLAAIE